jgi:hypothetical protein
MVDVIDLRYTYRLERMPGCGGPGEAIVEAYFVPKPSVNICMGILIANPFSSGLETHIDQHYTF